MIFSEIQDVRIIASADQWADCLFVRIKRELNYGYYHIKYASSISSVEMQCCCHLHQKEVHIQALEVLQRIPASPHHHCHPHVEPGLEIVVLEPRPQSPRVALASRHSPRLQRSAGIFDETPPETPCDRQDRHVGRNSCRRTDTGLGLGQSACTVFCWTQQTVSSQHGLLPILPPFDRVKTSLVHCKF